MNWTDCIVRSAKCGGKLEERGHDYTPGRRDNVDLIFVFRTYLTTSCFKIAKTVFK